MNNIFVLMIKLINPRKLSVKKYQQQNKKI